MEKYGILWTKPGKEPVLTQAGNDYATLDMYLEDAYMHSKYYRDGYVGEIVRVHKENDKWIC